MNIKGAVFVFTGTLALGTRTQAMTLVTKAGGLCGKSVTRETDYLVAGSDVGGTKLAKAATFGVQVTSEDEFLGMLKKK